MRVNNESCMFGGAHPSLAWSLHDPPTTLPSRRFLLALLALKRLGATVDKPMLCRPVLNDRSCDTWTAGVRVHAPAGSPVALAIGGLLKRLDPEAFDGSVRAYPVPRAAGTP